VLAERVQRRNLANACCVPSCRHCVGLIQTIRPRTMLNHPSSMLWTARNKGRWVECLVRLLPSGVDVEILIDGAALIAWTFATNDEALSFSAQQRREWAEER
jgi:hypothetical protein